MRVSWAPVSCAIAVAGSLMLAACARPAPAPEAAAPVFPRPSAAEVFSTGYGGIAERYIDTVAVDALALEGMRGLGAIDPSLTVERAGNIVTLATAGETIARFPAPEAGDVYGWSALTAAVSAAGRATSEELATVPPEKVYEAVFDGALSNLDVFSRYAGAEEAERNRARREGFDGIGITFRLTDGTARITRVIGNSPAHQAGLKPGDRITHVDGQLIAALTTRGISRLLRGPAGSRVNITVLGDDAPAPRDVDLERSHIVLPTVSARLDGGILFLTVDGFNQETAQSVADAITGARADLGAPPRGIVLDLRGNPGGLLKQAVRVADLFLPGGDIVTTRGRHPDSIQHYRASIGDMADGRPLVVLVDGKSASAAEIVVAALQDSGRGVVIGTNSFGKGTVQTVLRLPNEGEITLTWSRLVAPSGYALHGLGVLPAICTSGTHDDGDRAIAAFLERRFDAPATLAAWRETGRDQSEARRILRLACPAERRDEAVETALARRLIDDRALYRRALNMTAPTVAATD